MNNAGILFLLLVWCLTGSIPRWGMTASWVWAAVMFAFALVYNRRKKSVPIFPVTYTFPAGLFELEQLHFAGVPLQSTNHNLQLKALGYTLEKDQKHLLSCRALVIAITIIGRFPCCFC